MRDDWVDDAAKAGLIRVLLTTLQTGVQAMKQTMAGMWMTAMIALAIPAWAQAEDGSRLLGLWSVDVTQLPMPPEARPQRVTVAFEEAAADAWTVRVEIVPAEGEARISTVTVPLDGSTLPIEGDTLEADAIAVKRPTGDVLAMALAKNGVPASTRVYAVTADGDQLIETAVHFGADGKAVMRTFRFDRVR